MVMLSCGWMGIASARDLASRERKTRKALEMILRLRTEICVCRRSLPEAMERLREDFSLPAITWVFDDRPFREIWDDFFRQILPSGQALEAVEDLGRSLSGGEIPEQAFERCIPILESALEIDSRNRTQYGRVCVALGLSAGCMLTLMAL